jgi:hypothetical protein
LGRNKSARQDTGNVVLFVGRCPRSAADDVWSPTEFSLPDTFSNHYAIPMKSRIFGRKVSANER